MEHIEKVKAMCQAADAEHAKKLSSIRGKGARTDRVFWINGADRWNHDGLEMLIEDARRSAHDKIRAIEDQINSCNIKNIKGKPYWYQWIDGKHVYKGKEDPRPPLREQLKELHDAQKEKAERMRSCIIKKIDKHYVIDLVKYKEHVQARLGKGMILVSEVLA